MVSSVDYLGYLIDKDGLHPLPEKVAAILEAPQPKNVQELRAFLGLINYYGRFIRSNLPLESVAVCKGVTWVGMIGLLRGSRLVWPPLKCWPNMMCFYLLN